MSSRTTFSISSASWAPFCHGLSETKGKHRLLVFRVLCCSTVREAFPMKSDDARYSLERVLLKPLFSASNNLGCSMTSAFMNT